MVWINWFRTRFFYYRNCSWLRNDLFKIIILSFLPVMFFLPSLVNFLKKGHIYRGCVTGSALGTKQNARGATTGFLAGKIGVCTCH